MSRLETDCQMPVDCECEQGPKEHTEQAQAEVLDSNCLNADCSLASRCVAGEVSAWEELYAQCHAPLLASIRGILGHHGGDPNLVEEIAARVWYALVKDDGELLSKYDPAREARLITFMRAVACDLARRHFRSERRRLEREVVAAQERQGYHAADFNPETTSLDGFLETLSAGERDFVQTYLLENPDGACGNGHAISPTNLWQRTRRVYKRLLRFLDRDS